MDPQIKILLAASASFTALIIVIVIIVSLRRAKRTQIPQTRIPKDAATLSSIVVDDSAAFDTSINRISMQELVDATRDFATDGIIGDGSFGLVYKARLSDGVTVAVKKLSPDAFQGFREFRAEMETLGKLRHPNLVRILGYCVSGPDRILIYEFIERGCLDQWVHDTSSEPLPWETRIKVIRGVAMGLGFLHNSEPPIIHRDIKASNVLLDSEFEAHIADFGFARRVEGSNSHVSTQVAGTMGYMPPEFKAGNTTATVRADVYSFGMLMIEVATGKRPNLPVKMEENRVEVGLIEWARKMVEESREMEMVDPRVSKEGLRGADVKEFLRIACLCTNEIPKDRPPMSVVMTLLNQLCA